MNDDDLPPLDDDPFKDDEEDILKEEELIQEAEALKEEEALFPREELIEKKESKEALLSSPSSLETISIDEIPVTIHVEVARLNISLGELQKMEPGQKLPIDINPRLVNLTVNGKSIGRGEIVEFGEIIGVKILELYSS